MSTNNLEVNESKELEVPAEIALTTIDNPYDPFSQFRDWFLFDMRNGYNSCNLLARVAKISDYMSDSEVNDELERAIDEIIKYDLTSMYTKVRNKNYKKEKL